MAELIDMKNTGTGSESLVTAEGDKPAYPWGLTLNLNDEVLTKLGLTELPSVGANMRLEARVRVTSVSQHEREQDDKDRRVSLQITAMALRSDTDRASQAERLFGDAAED